jgi:type II secretory ATPase GspE/PulE/Tfp pilus assembly ATPase PilB-like protein
MEVEPFLVSSTINVIIAQRLLRVLYTSKKSYFLSDDEVENLKKYCDLEKITQILKERNIINKDQTIKDIKFFKPIETEKAPDGYRGRVAAFEVLKVTEEIKNLIVQRASSSKIKEEARKEGMVTMLEDGIIKAAQGVTSIEEVLRVLIE